MVQRYTHLLNDHKLRAVDRINSFGLKEHEYLLSIELVPLVRETGWNPNLVVVECKDLMKRLFLPADDRNFDKTVP